jgi:chromosome segregation protein
LRVPGIVPVGDVLRIVGPHAVTIQKVIPEAYIADSFEQAATFSSETSAPVATISGDVFRGRHLVSGGAKAESRGILATRREVKELRDRSAADRSALVSLMDEVTSLEVMIATATSAITALTAEQHRQEKEIVAHDAQLARLGDDTVRLTRKADVIALERRQAEDERASIDTRTTDAQQQLVRLQEQHRFADERFNAAQRALQTGRETAADLMNRAAEARAIHAALVERVAALAADVVRLRDAAVDLEQRIATRSAERAQMQARREELLQSVAAGEQTLDEAIRSLDTTREHLRGADDAAAAVRAAADAHDATIREARQQLEGIRADVSGLDIARATAESDLTHLAQSCSDAVQLTLDQVLADVEEMERSGSIIPDAAAITAEEPADLEDEPGLEANPEPRIPHPGSMSAEEAIVALKAKIDRLGPVNMMAIEQFDELETRHAFLTTQRKDLVDSIAQTVEAIKRIDETSKVRFAEAFAAIQENFQSTFGTLFGGGRAGLTLLDENDPLESGIDIVASPPGKRLQSVQLLSGGEKALTAIALMFAIFKYKPSPFCLLDEIDAPLDDANVGRFVEMLRGMLDRTQFILITHNRRTMEIANRLYGVTMEEPGVSKLISVQLN